MTGQIVVETGTVDVTVVTVELPGHDGTSDGHCVRVRVVVLYTVEVVYEIVEMVGGATGDSSVGLGVDSVGRGASVPVAVGSTLKKEESVAPGTSELLVGVGLEVADDSVGNGVSVSSVGVALMVEDSVG